MLPINRYLSLIDAPENGKFPYCYCLLVDDQVRVLFDSGCSLEQAAKLRERGIDVVVNTHFHIDHTLQNKNLGPVQVWIHGLDAAGVTSVETHLQMYGWELDGNEELGPDFAKIYHITAGQVDREFDDGEVFDFGQTRFKVFHTPGHTPGHCVFYEEKSGILFSGDITLSDFGPWYSHKCSDLDDMLSSIEKCREIKPRMVVSGHVGIIEDNIEQRFLAFRDYIFRKEEKIWNALETPATVEELASRQFQYGAGARLNRFRRDFEKHFVNQHLKRLIRLGLVNREGECYFRV